MPDSLRAPSPVQSAVEDPGGFRHIPALDGIRGSAILLVLACHLLASDPVTGSKLLDIFQELHSGTYAGVNLFFTLSGFLITGILIDTLNIQHYFKTFYARRSLRIFPLYYGSLAVLLLLTRPLHFQWHGWQWFYLTYTANLALWRNYVPLDLGSFNIVHFWSLQVEEQFYLVWPFVVYRIKQPAKIARVALIACVPVFLVRVFFVAVRHQAHFHWPYLTVAPTISCADNLLFGCALSALLRTSARKRVFSFAPVMLGVCLGLLAVVFFVNHGFAYGDRVLMPTIGFTLLGLTSASLIADTLRENSRTQRVFSLSFLRFFGKYSYGIYVFHYSLDRFLTTRLRAAIFADSHSKALAVLSAAFIIAGASVIAAMLSYYLYESPFLHLKRYFGYARSVKREMPVALTP